jgi:ribulose bisphosphate carboxylase small subunit
MPSNKSFLSPYQATSAVFAVASCGMPAKRGPVMAMATSVIENFADQIRVCADQGWKINIFIRYIAPFP